MSGTATIHATCVAIDGKAVLLTGASGAGKSDLALRLIDRGAMLVADDYTVLTPDAGGLTAGVPTTIAGRIELRGVGILTQQHLPAARVMLVVELGPEAERMPEPRLVTVHGVGVPVIVVDPHHSSAPIKVEWALRHVMEIQA